MSNEIKIGDIIYGFDVNCRVYPEGKISGPIYFEHFFPVTVHGETKMSWLCARNPEHTDHGTYKVNKVSLLHANGSYSPIKFYTEQGKADNIWKRDNYCNLEKLIVQSSGEILKKIAELVGYKEEIK